MECKFSSCLSSPFGLNFFFKSAVFLLKLWYHVSNLKWDSEIYNYQTTISPFSSVNIEYACIRIYVKREFKRRWDNHHSLGTTVYHTDYCWLSDLKISTVHHIG